MCRYSMHPARTHYACIPCRFTTKFPVRLEPICTRCGGPMIDLGRDFKAPRRCKEDQWRKVEMLSDRERIILTAPPDATVRDLAGLIAVGKSQAAIIRERLFNRLRDELTDHPDPDSAVSQLQDRSLRTLDHPEPDSDERCNVG